MACAAAGSSVTFSLPGDELQVIGDEICRDAMKIEALAAAEDCRQDLLRLGRREDELHVRRRFLERLQQRVEGGRGEHVHFVDDVDLEMPFARRVAHVIAQLAHLLDAVVARAVDLEHVEAIAAGDLLAAVAHAAGRDRRPVHAIERLGQDARGGGFPDSARPDEEVGVREAVLLDRVLERARDVRLPDKIVERLRPVFARENLIAHVPNLMRRRCARKQKRPRPCHIRVCPRGDHALSRIKLGEAGARDFA